MESIFHMLTPIRELIWHSNAWAQTRSMSCNINRANVHKLEGIVTLRNFLDSYGVGLLNRV
jgi:hypothetical protein